MCFNTFLDMDIDDIVLIYRGSEFHKLGAFTELCLAATKKFMKITHIYSIETKYLQILMF